MTQSKQKVWLIVGAAIGLLLIAILVTYRWGSRSLAGLMDQAQVTVEQGRALGTSLTASACVDTAFARHAKMGGTSLLEHLNEGIFLESCLRASKPSGICDSVPSAEGLSGMVRFQEWSIEECRVRGLRDRMCPNLLQPVLHYCDRRTPPPA